MKVCIKCQQIYNGLACIMNFRERSFRDTDSRYTGLNASLTRTDYWLLRKFTSYGNALRCSQRYCIRGKVVIFMRLNCTCEISELYYTSQKPV